MMNIEGSVSLIEERGSELEKAKMRWILHGAEPDPAVVTEFTGLQNLDGGFPCGMKQGCPSAVHRTLAALSWMDDLGTLDSPAAERALAFLLAVQGDDGGWDEDPSITRYDLPPWIKPGELPTRLYLSSLSAYWLGLQGYEGHDAFQRALDFLALPDHRDEAGRFRGFTHSTWIATSVFLVAGHRHSEVVTRGLRVLMDRPVSEWVDSQMCWAIECLGRAGLEREHPFIEGCLTELLRRQRPDGSWSSEDGEARAVGATIAALKVLKHFGLLDTRP